MCRTIHLSEKKISCTGSECVCITFNFRMWAAKVGGTLSDKGLGCFGWQQTAINIRKSTFG